MLVNLKEILEYAEKENAKVVSLCAKVEEELSEGDIEFTLKRFPKFFKDMLIYFMSLPHKIWSYIANISETISHLCTC